MSSDLFIDYVPAFTGVPGWERVYRQQRVMKDEDVVRRVIVENTANRHQRVLVDVTETATDESAFSFVRAVAADSNAALTPGPVNLGVGALQHPEVKPTWIYFLRANLAIWVFSCGKDPVDVSAWADRIAADLDTPLVAGYDPALIFERVPDRSSAIHLQYAVRWTVGEWGWFKFQTPLGTLKRGAAPKTVTLIPAGHLATVHGWVQEPGRETYQGQYSGSL